jgi:hypothetical protein
MTDIPTDLVPNLELLLAYSPGEGRLWRTNAEGTPIRELVLWRWDAAKGHYVTSSIDFGEKSKRMTHVIFFMMSKRWPLPDHVIDHRDRNPTNNAFSNLREATHAENSRNADHTGQRCNGAGELLEQCVQKRAAGYVVVARDLYFGIYQSSVEANQVARQQRRELYGEFALAPVTSRRIIRGTAA